MLSAHHSFLYGWYFACHHYSCWIFFEWNFENKPTPFLKGSECRQDYWTTSDGLIIYNATTLNSNSSCGKKNKHVISDFHMHILVQQLGLCLISSLLSNCSWRTPASTKRHRSFLSDLPAHTISPLVLSSPPLLSPAHLHRATPPLHRSGTPNRSRSDALYRGPLTPRML